MLTDDFRTYLEDGGKAHNTILSYVRSIMAYATWYQESLGAEVQTLYRANVLDFVSYLRTVKQLSNRSVNSKLAALLCFNEFLVSTGAQADIVLGKRDYLTISHPIPCGTTFAPLPSRPDTPSPRWQIRLAIAMFTRASSTPILPAKR